jgi:hypothetical protein
MIMFILDVLIEVLNVTFYVFIVTDEIIKFVYIFYNEINCRLRDSSICLSACITLEPIG